MPAAVSYESLQLYQNRSEHCLLCVTEVGEWCTICNISLTHWKQVHTLSYYLFIHLHPHVRYFRERHKAHVITQPWNLPYLISSSWCVCSSVKGSLVIKLNKETDDYGLNTWQIHTVYTDLLISFVNSCLDLIIFSLQMQWPSIPITNEHTSHHDALSF